MTGGQDGDSRERPPAGGGFDESRPGPASSAEVDSKEGRSEPADDEGCRRGSDEAARAPGAAQAPDAAQDVEADLDKLLADTQRERDEYLELAKRTKADFENYRKRMSADIAAAAVRGKAELARELIDGVDNLERALQAAGIDAGQADRLADDADLPDDGLAHGVLLVFRGLREALSRNGIEAVDPKGERFDPNLHEALSTLAADGAEAGTVVEVIQKGYRLGEQLIRPARVVVAE